MKKDDKLKALKMNRENEKPNTIAPLQTRTKKGKGGRPEDFPDVDTKMIRVKLPIETLKALQKAIPDTDHETYSTFTNAALLKYIDSIK